MGRKPKTAESKRSFMLTISLTKSEERALQLIADAEKLTTGREAPLLSGLARDLILESPRMKRAMG